jgi:murein tripeptide amidase MpaA
MRPPFRHGDRPAVPSARTWVFTLIACLQSVPAARAAGRERCGRKPVVTSVHGAHRSARGSRALLQLLQQLAHHPHFAAALNEQRAIQQRLAQLRDRTDLQIRQLSRVNGRPILEVRPQRRGKSGEVRRILVLGGLAPALSGTAGSSAARAMRLVEALVDDPVLRGAADITVIPVANPGGHLLALQANLEGQLLFDQFGDGRWTAETRAIGRLLATSDYDAVIDLWDSNFGDLVGQVMSRRGVSLHIIERVARAAGLSVTFRKSRRGSTPRAVAAGDRPPGGPAQPGSDRPGRATTSLVSHAASLGMDQLYRLARLDVKTPPPPATPTLTPATPPEPADLAPLLQDAADSPALLRGHARLRSVIGRIDRLRRTAAGEHRPHVQIDTLTEESEPPIPLVRIAATRENARKVLLIGGVHAGTELLGVELALRTTERWAARDDRPVELVVLPLASPASLLLGRRTGADHRDLNRSFADGHWNELAWWIAGLLGESFHAVIDLHGTSFADRDGSFVIAGDPDSATLARQILQAVPASLQLSRAGAGQRYQHWSQPGHAPPLAVVRSRNPHTLRGYAARTGPAVTVEINQVVQPRAQLQYLLAGLLATLDWLK